MRVDVLTLFPGMFDGPMNDSMMWKAQDRGLLDLRLHNIRDYATNKHRSVDDTPYGGGGGMILRADVMIAAIESVVGKEAGSPVILMSPQGRPFSHEIALELSRLERMTLVCGHYEGFDERIRSLAITDEISIGDYVLTGGELAAMVVIDAVIRQIPDLLGAEGAAEQDSYADGLIEGPHYTRPATFRGLAAPEILQSGDHQKIRRWRREQALRRTWRQRPDLLMKATLTESDQHFLATLALEDAARIANNSH